MCHANAVMRKETNHVRFSSEVSRTLEATSLWEEPWPSSGSALSAGLSGNEPCPRGPGSSQRDVASSVDLDEKRTWFVSFSSQASMAYDVLLASVFCYLCRASCARELDLGASFPPRSSSSRASPRGRTSPRRRKRTRAAEATAAGKQTHDENEDRTRTPRHIRTQTSLLSCCFCVLAGDRAIFWFVCCDGYISRRPGGRSLSL